MDLDGSEAIRAVEPRLAELFRCDAYGNVVSIQASGSAVCAFEADHIFPWSRYACQTFDARLSMASGAE